LKILVTGAAGFLASRTALHLHAAGDEVIALDRSDADRGRLDALVPTATFVGCNLHDAGEVDAVVDRVKPDIVSHFAWYGVPGKYLDAPENLDHLTSTIHLARAVARSGCRRFVMAGTCFEYDTSLGTLSESSPTAPKHLYSASKLAVAIALREACKRWSMAYCHVRFFYQYGPWEADARLVPSLAKALLAGEEALATSGEQIRDYLHIDDVGRAAALIAKSDLDGVVNVGSGAGVRIRDIAVAVERACGVRDKLRLGALPSREGDPACIVADATRLRSLGWSPRYVLDDGIADTVAWFKSRSIAR